MSTASRIMTVPEHLQGFELHVAGNDFKLIYDDPYASMVADHVEYATVGSMKEEDVAKRCWENGWRVSKEVYGFSKDIDFCLSAKGKDTVRVQVKAAAYSKLTDNFVAGINCTKNGNKKSTYSPEDVDFFVIWMPILLEDALGKKRGLYIIPVKDVQDMKRRLIFYPHKEPGKIALANMKIPDMNKYFEAWHLLNDFTASLANE